LWGWNPKSHFLNSIHIIPSDDWVANGEIEKSGD
jgi:hypothetical protein